MTHDIVIIGAGPSGISCAIQLKRSGFEPVVLEKHVPGGLLINACLVENYPGFPNGISGPDLADLLVKHSEKNGINIRREEVVNADYENGHFSIRTDKGEFGARYLVLASGTAHKSFDSAGIPDICSDYIFYEIFPILKTSGKTIAIVGSGDAAFDYAMNLGRQNRIILINRGDSASALGLLQERVNGLPDFTYKLRTEVTGISSRESGIRLELVQGENKFVLDIDFLVIAIGREPNLDYISVRLKEKMKELEDKKRLWRIGDLCHGKFRQASIAVGDGVRAAMEITDKLTEKEQ